jgi:ring-1,2-phenylacetyl-CoA epoxidase subunit PaaB
METFEVFRRAGHREPFTHCGTVLAPDSEMALLMAKECFLRRREGDRLWVVRRSDVSAFEDESLLEVADDKSYRFAADYRDVVGKRERARLRALALVTPAPESGDGKR